MEHGENPSYGYSALHTAVISRDLRAVQALTTELSSNGCDLDSRDSMGFTSLHLATLQENKELVQILVTAGCDVNSRTKEGMTSLHLSSERAGAEDILSVLAASSCEVNARNKLGRTALHLAAKLGNPQNLKVLLDAGCDRNIKDKLGFTAVGLAFKFNQKGSADILLHYKPRRNRSSSKESFLDENENEPERKDVERKLTDINHCLSAGPCFDRVPSMSTSFNSKQSQISFQELCNKTILKLTDRKKELPGKACHLILAMLQTRRDKLDGLANSRKSCRFVTLFEQNLLNLFLAYTSLIHYPSPVYTVTTLDARLGKRCLCDLKTHVIERYDPQNLESDLLVKLLQDLKDSLACQSRNQSTSISVHCRSLLLPLTSSKLQERKDSEPAVDNLEAFEQMLRKVCNGWSDGSIQFIERGAEDFKDCLLKLEQSLPISDSVEDKDDLPKTESSFVADKTVDYLSCLDNMITMKSTPASFAEEILELFFQNSGIFISCLNYRGSMFGAILNKYLSRDSAWVADKIAKRFLQVCVALASEQRLLLKCAGAVMKKGLLHKKCNAVSLGTCILIRMGLLKGEFDVDIVTDLTGPLTALEQEFKEKYFPRDVAAIFASFLCKSSPKMFGLEQLRLRALASAVIREILPTSVQEAESDTGKSFKRICDIVALEEDWELLIKCVDVLFSRVFVTLKCKVGRIGESLLIYLGLLKSEFCIETVRNLRCALRLLHHVVKQSYFPPKLKDVFLCFLQKPNPVLYSCSKEVDEILRTLLDSKGCS